MENLGFLCFDLHAKILKCNLVYVKTHNETKNTENYKNNKIKKIHKKKLEAMVQVRNYTNKQIKIKNYKKL